MKKYRVPQITIVAVINLGVEFSKSISSMIISLLFRTRKPAKLSSLPGDFYIPPPEPGFRGAEVLFEVGKALEFF